MVYSASSARTVLATGSDGTDYLVKYLGYGFVGFIAMQVASRMPLERVRAMTPILLGVAFALLLLVKVPGIGIEINGARRWIGAGPLQFQPSELMKIALVLYSVHLLAQRPQMVQTLRGILSPLLVVALCAAALIASQPDLGTALVCLFTVGTLLLV